ncbi:HAD family hydrolase [Tenggerimyces flavus]|uniref:HAD family hydrolase n=1 Tax=Tenggerimyces flavus TaxID=1708749 RepID=A0ABV7YA74_9ACTN|nr:HAD family hydrolase [Tenggerimyces flavus]MBM7783720.1 putative hydrolase of the HAD superfamily [Tenggerimyces flavus]
MTRPQAVVFDLYETLVTEFDPSWQAKPTTADRLGVDADVFERGWRARRDERMTRPIDFREILRDLSPEADDQVIEALYQERLAAKAAPLLNVEQLILDTLGRLKADGLGIGLISNCSTEEVAAWHRSALAPLVDEAVFSYQVGCAKPDPAIYALACRRLGVAPRDAVFVGDGGSDELSGAAACGMRAYCAGWFLDRWPTRRPVDGFRRLGSPAEVLDVLL